MADPVLIAVSLVSPLLTYLGVRSANRSAAAKTEGIITTEIRSMTERMDRKDEENNSRFARIESDNANQWGVIRQTQADLGYLQGKANGKAAGR